MESVSCISLDDKIFRTVLGTYIRDLNQDRLKHLQNLRIFNGWDRVSLVSLLTHIYIRSPNRDEFIYKQGDVDKNIYIVINGELELVAEYDPEQEKEENRILEVKSNQEKFEGKYLSLEKPLRQEMAIFKLSTGNYFGDEDGFSCDVKRFGVRVKSSATKIFLIPKDVKKKITLLKKFHSFKIFSKNFV